MRIEFKGVTLVLDTTDCSFTLTVGDETITFTPREPEKADKPDKAVYYYRLQFNPHTVWNTLFPAGKIPAIKAIRQNIGCGLGEAKAIVEGETICLFGPMWSKSDLKRALDSVAPGTYTVTPCERFNFVSATKYT